MSQKRYYLSVCIWFQEWAHFGPESTVPMHQLRLFTLQLFLDFRAIFFPDWPLIFLVITIHQVTWPSPGTLGTPRSVEDETRNAELRWGWVFLEQTRILSGIQFTTRFIEIFVVETKLFVGSFVHVILTRKTCGQRSSRAAESKRRALGNYFSERICHMFLISNCTGDRDLGLCTTSVLAFGEPQRNGKFRFLYVKTRVFFGFCRCAAVLQTQVTKMCTDLDLGLL